MLSPVGVVRHDAWLWPPPTHSPEPTFRQSHRRSRKIVTKELCRRSESATACVLHQERKPGRTKVATKRQPDDHRRFEMDSVGAERAVAPPGCGFLRVSRRIRQSCRRRIRDTVCPMRQRIKTSGDARKECYRSDDLRTVQNRFAPRYAPPNSTKLLIQNTGPMPNAEPSAPKTSGTTMWVRLLAMVRTPFASPARPVGDRL